METGTICYRPMVTRPIARNVHFLCARPLSHHRAGRRKGVGSEVTEFSPDSLGVGIGGVRQRIKEFGGEVRLKNANPGTLVEVVVLFPEPFVRHANQRLEHANRCMNLFLGGEL